METVKKKSTKCVLIHTNEPVADAAGNLTNRRRTFFLEKKNVRYVVPFAKAMGADLKIVRAKTPNILSLPELIRRLNDNEYNDTSEFSTKTEEVIDLSSVQKKSEKRGIKISKTKNKVEAIQKAIQYCLEFNPLWTQKKQVSIHELRQACKPFGVSDSTIRRHLKIVKEKYHAK